MVRDIKLDDSQYNRNLMNSVDEQKHENQSKDGLRGIRPTDKSKEQSLKKMNSDLKIASRIKAKEDQEDDYDLDLQIADLSLNTLPADCSIKSEYPRCSRECQTIRGATCPNCDTQDSRRTCIRC